MDHALISVIKDTRFFLSFRTRRRLGLAAIALRKASASKFIYLLVILIIIRSGHLTNFPSELAAYIYIPLGC